MTARHLVVGLDGADLSVVRSLGASTLPTLHRLMNTGAFAALESVMPPATLPNWLTFLTALDPGEHGVFDFTTRDGYSVAFRGGTAREAPLLAERLDALGLRTAWLGFPGTWPPPPLAHGIFLSGWDSPVAFAADASFVWPQPLHADLTARFGPLTFDDVDEFHADEDEWHEKLPSALLRRIAKKRDLASTLLTERSWDAFAVYFGESDTAAHHLWSLHDAHSPRRPANAPDAAPSGLTQVYAALDDALAALLDAAGAGAEITVVSDHGSGGSSDKVLYLNRALAEAGLLAFRPARVSEAALRRLKAAALERLPARARERVFHAFERRLPGWLESAARFGALDFAQTRAFSDELNYFPAVHLNLAGREPEGIVRAGERDRVAAEVTDVLSRLRDPWSGAPVVRAVHRREALYRGPHLGRAPDLLLELEVDDGYTYNLMPSASAPPGTGPFRRLSPDEWLGRKGRSLPGSHRPRGLYIAGGPRVASAGEIDAHIADASVTFLARLGVAPPPEARGRVLWEILHAADGLRAAPNPARRQAEGDSAHLEGRLRALGYVD